MSPLLMIPLLPIALFLMWYLVLRRPVLGGVVLLVLLYTRVSDVGIAFHNLPSIAQPYIFVFTVAVFVRRTLAGGSRSLAAGLPLWCAIGLYLAVDYASSIWAVDGSVAIAQGTELLKNLLIVYLIAETFSSLRTQRWALWAVLLSGAFLAMLTVLQAATHSYGNSFLGLAQNTLGQVVGAYSTLRAEGPVGDPNEYALVLVALVPLALFRLRDEHRLVLRALAALCLIMLVAGIILTYSRSGLLVLAAMLVVAVPLLGLRFRHIALLCLVMLPLLPLVPQNYWLRVASITQGDASVQGRVGSQEVALAIFADHPLFGVGADNYAVVYFPYALRLHATYAAGHAHDFYLAVAAETGLAGLATFGTAMLLLLRAIWRRRAVMRLMGDRVGEGIATSSMLALSAYLLGNCFLPVAYPRYLWIIAGIALAVALPSDEVSWQLAEVELPRWELGADADLATIPLDWPGHETWRDTVMHRPRALPDNDSGNGSAASAGRLLVRGGVLSYGSFMLGKIFMFTSNLILARLLLPSDFGLVGYALLVLSFLDVLKNLGVTSALIYRQDITDEEAGETFALALGIATFFTVLTWLLAPVAAVFFHDPRVTLVTRLLSVSFVLDALGVVHVTMLQKKLRYGRRFIPDLVLNVAKGSIAAVLAVAGFGYWSLVWGQLAGTCAFMLASWRMYPWLPRPRLRWASARRTLTYGMHVSLVDIIGAVVLNFDNVIVGRVLGTAALGMYALAFSIPQMLTISIATALSRVVFPLFASLQHDVPAMRKSYLLVLRYSALVLLPVGVGFCVVTVPFVHALYRPVWWSMSPVMQALSIYALFQAVGWHAGDVYMAMGRPDVQWKLSLAQAAALVPALILGAWLGGMLGVGIARVVVVLPFSLISFWLIHRFLALPYRSMAEAMRVPTVAALVMGAACLLAAQAAGPHDGAVSRLLLEIAAGAIVYPTAVLVLDADLRARVISRIGVQWRRARVLSGPQWMEHADMPR